MATQKSLPFGTTNTTDDVVYVFDQLAGGNNVVHVFDIPFEEVPDLIAGVSEGALETSITAVLTATQITIYAHGAGGAEKVSCTVRGQLKSTSDKLP